MLFLELSWTTHSLDVYKQIIEVYEILFFGVCIICCPEAFLWHFSNICKISCMLNSFIQTIIEASPDWITWTEFWWLIAAKSVIYCWKKHNTRFVYNNSIFSSFQTAYNFTMLLGISFPLLSKDEVLWNVSKPHHQHGYFENCSSICHLN